MTACYLLVLSGVYGVFSGALSAKQVDHCEMTVSTNLENLTDHPVLSLLGSCLLVSGPIFVPIVLVGVGAVLGWFERRLGSMKALGAFLLGHVGATLLTVPVIILGIATGYFSPAVSHTYDFGVSYGALTVTAAATGLLPSRWRPWWLGTLAAALLIYSSDAGLDFTFYGHLFSVLIGIGLAARIAIGEDRGKGLQQLLL